LSSTSPGEIAGLTGSEHFGGESFGAELSLLDVDRASIEQLERLAPVAGA
jgi:hypothetical protein